MLKIILSILGFVSFGFSFSQTKEFSSEDYKEVINYCNHMLSGTPNNIRYLKARADAHISLGNYSNAIQDYTRITEISTDSSQQAESYFSIGYSESKLGSNLKSIDGYTQAIRLKPSYLDAYYNRGIQYLRKGKYSKCLKDMNHVVENSSDTASLKVDAYYNRSTCAKKLEDLELATEDMEKVILQNKNDWRLHKELGELYYLQNQKERACNSFSKVMELGGEIPDKYTSICP